MNKTLFFSVLVVSILKSSVAFFIRASLLTLFVLENNRSGCGILCYFHAF